MTDRPVSAFLLSTTLHSVVVGIFLLLSYAANQQVKKPNVLVLVAGEGDNYMAKAAPALGTPGGVNLDVPAPPAPKAEPAMVEPVKAEPAPITPVKAAPVTPVKAAPPPPKKAAVPPPPPTFVRQINNTVNKAVKKAKTEVAKERKAEAKRAEEEKKKQDRMTKADFDKLNKATATPTPKGSPTKVAKINPEGIVKGVAGGSTENKTGGAGGKALTNDNDDVLDAYYALFKQRLTREFDAPPGLSDTLEVTIQARSNPDGSITGAKVVRASGSTEFDRAVLAAVARTTMRSRPDNRSEQFEFTFSMRDKEDL